MKLKWICGVALLVMPTVGLPTVGAAQQQVSLFGTWKVDPKLAAKQKSGPTLVIVRPDSSASYGKETVRWRLPKKDEIMLALGGEWVTYKLKLKAKELTLSGGDLTDPITLERVGPPTPRPDSIPVPPDPDTQPQ